MCIQFHIPRGEYWITKYFRTYLFLVINLGISLNLGRKANIFHLWYLLGIKLINYWFNFTTDSRKIVSLYTGHTWLSMLHFPAHWFGKKPYISELSHLQSQASHSNKTGGLQHQVLTLAFCWGLISWEQGQQKSCSALVLHSLWVNRDLVDLGSWDPQGLGGASCTLCTPVIIQGTDEKEQLKD